MQCLKLTSKLQVSGNMMTNLRESDGVKVADRIKTTTEHPRFPIGSLGTVYDITDWKDVSYRVGDEVHHVEDKITFTVNMDDRPEKLSLLRNEIEVVDAPRIDALPQYTKCPGCNETRFQEESWFRVCNACDARYGITKDANAVFKEIGQERENPDYGRAVHFNFRYIDENGLVRSTHGFYNPETHEVLQWG